MTARLDHGQTDWTTGRWVGHTCRRGADGSGSGGTCCGGGWSSSPESFSMPSHPRTLAPTCNIKQVAARALNLIVSGATQSRSQPECVGVCDLLGVSPLPVQDMDSEVRHVM